MVSVADGWVNRELVREQIQTAAVGSQEYARMKIAFSSRWYSTRQGCWHPDEYLFFGHHFADCPAPHPVYRVCAHHPVARLRAMIFG